MIPKIIHYCWFGGNPLPPEAVRCIESWKKYCPDYEIREWNESNFDLNCCDYVREAYEAKKWAFVSDYARLDMIYKNGGVYLDVDVELLRPLDDLLTAECFLALEKNAGTISSGLGFGAAAGYECVGWMLEQYKDAHFRLPDGTIDELTCPIRNTRPFLELGLDPWAEHIQHVGGAVIYPPEYFSPGDYRSGDIEITEKTYSIHHYSASWQTERHKKWLLMERRLKKCFGPACDRLYAFGPWRLLRSLYIRGVADSFRKLCGEISTKEKGKGT